MSIRYKFTPIYDNLNKEGEKVKGIIRKLSVAEQFIKISYSTIFRMVRHRFGRSYPVRGC